MRLTANRWTPVTHALMVAVLAGFVSWVAEPLGAQEPRSPWPVFQHDSQHMGWTNVAGPAWNTSADVKVKWTKEVQQFSTLSTSVITKDGLVLAGGVDPNGQGFVSALHPVDGREVWRTSGFNGNPTYAAVGPSGDIYVCVGAPVGSLGALYAFGSDGSFRWRFDIPQGAHRPCNTPIVSSSGVVYTTTPPPLNSQVAALFAINSDGTEKWRYEESNNGTTMAALSNDESQVYAVFHGRLLAFDFQSGQKLWEQSAPNPSANFILGSFGPTVDALDRIFLVTFEPNRDCGLYGNSLVAYAKDGSFLWERPSISCAGSLRAVGVGAEGALVVSGFDYLLWIDAQTGNQIGNPIVLPGLMTTGLAIDAAGRIYVGTSMTFNSPGSQNGIAAVDSNQVVWFFPTSTSPAPLSPAMGADGTIYSVAGNSVFALGNNVVIPPPQVSSVTPPSGLQGQTLAVSIFGSGFQVGATCDFGTNITVNSSVYVSPTQLTANIAIMANATVGLRDVSVTNPDGQSGTVASGFEVIQGSPEIALSPPSVNFGTVELGTRRTLDVLVSNLGAGPLVIGSIEIAGEYFSLLEVGSFPTTLNPGQTTTVRVTFAPTAQGTFQGSIDIGSNAPASPTTVLLNGVGAPAPLPTGRKRIFVSWTFGGVLEFVLQKETNTIQTTQVQFAIRNIQPTWYEVSVTPAGQLVQNPKLPPSFILGPNQVKSDFPTLVFGPGESVSFFADRTSEKALCLLGLDLVWRVATGAPFPTSQVDRAMALLRQQEPGQAFLISLGRDILNQDAAAVLSDLLSAVGNRDVINFLRATGLVITNQAALRLRIISRTGSVLVGLILNLSAPPADGLLVTATRLD